MASTAFPRFFVMQSTHSGPYLRVRQDPVTNESSARITFDGKDIWSPLVKFEAEQSKTGDATLVHIRSCHNNKYWVAVYNAFERRNYVHAFADKPEEDTTNPSCTLFRPSFVSSGGTIFTGFRLLHIHLSQSVTDRSFNLALSELGSTHTITDWAMLVILPPQVSFRSQDLNGNYLCSRVIDRLPYHKFESGLDIGDPLVAHELFPTDDGKYRIKNLHFGNYLRLAASGSWILADAADINNTNFRDTLFDIIKVSDNVIALRNMGNSLLCGADTREGKVDCLRAGYQTITRQAMLIVEERVLQREIQQIHYRLSESRIYQEELLEVTHAFATNDSLVNDSTVTLGYSTTESRTTHWNNTISLDVGVTTTLRVTIIPLIVSGTVETSVNFGYTSEWGEIKTTESTRNASYTVVVPPQTKMKVTLMCTKATCDVPFSYTQTDLLPNGERVSTIKDDGIYTGINSYNFYFEASKVVEDAKGRVYL